MGRSLLTLGSWLLVRGRGGGVRDKRQQVTAGEQPWFLALGTALSVEEGHVLRNFASQHPRQDAKL
jgi:hypothetical protein